MFKHDSKYRNKIIVFGSGCFNPGQGHSRMWLGGGGELADALCLDPQRGGAEAMRCDRVTGHATLAGTNSGRWLPIDA